MKKNLFLASMLTVLMCACSQSDELIGDATSLTSDEIGFASTFVNNGTRLAGEMTNTTIKTDGNNFGVWGSKTASGATTATPIFTNQEVKYTAASGKWDYTPHRYWDAQAAYTFNATMPMDATNASCADGKVTWKEIPLSALVATGTDYLVSKKVTSPAAAKRDQVKFTFQHILSKLNVLATASYGSGDDVTVDLNSLKLSLPNGKAVYTEASADGPNKDADTWAWTPDGTTPTTQYAVQATDVRMNNSDIYKKLTNSYFVAPTVKDAKTDLKMDIKFTVTYNASKTDGSKATEVFEYKNVDVQDLHTFTQGYITNLYVKINLNAINFGVEKVISFATATVEDWTDSDDNYIDELGYSFNFTGVKNDVASAGLSAETEVATIDTYGNKVVGTTATALTYKTDAKVYSNAECTTAVDGASSTVGTDLKVKVNNIPANATNEVKTYYVKVTTNQDDSRVLAFTQQAASPIFTVSGTPDAKPMDASYTFVGTDLVMTVAQLDDSNTARVIVIDKTTGEEVQLTTNDAAATGTQTHNNATGAYSSILSGLHNGKTVTFTPAAGHTYSVEIHCTQDPLLYTKYDVTK